MFMETTQMALQSVFSPNAAHSGRGSFINDVQRFLTIIDPPNVRFLPYKRPIFWMILDPPTHPKIGHH